MNYEIKLMDTPNGLQAREQYLTLTGEQIEFDVLISTAVSATLITREAYRFLSDEPLQPMKPNLNYNLQYVPTIPKPQRGLIKQFTLGGQPCGDLPVIVCDCEIGYGNQLILGTDILLKKCKRFSTEGETLTIET